MQTIKMLQTVVLMLLVALAASCAAGKDYGAKLFRPRNSPAGMPDSSVATLRFLDMDTSAAEMANWVSTDQIMGRDTGTGTAALDVLAEKLPAARKDSAKQDPVKEPPKQTGPVILTETKRPVMKEESVVRNYDMGPVRTKRQRESP